jgi:hypothetical protein
MFRYTSVVAVIVLLGPDRVLAAAAERNQASTKATRRCPTCPLCSNHSNMLVDRWFMFRYAVVVAAVADREKGEGCSAHPGSNQGNSTS